MDPRLTPANSRIAHESLRGKVDAPAYTQGTWRRVGTGVVDILKAPGGRRNRQALFGERLLHLEDHDGFAFVQAKKDGYVGYVASDRLMDDAQATHVISAPGSHLYPAPDFKQHEVDSLSFGARVTVTGMTNRLSETDTGQFVPTAHLAPVGAPLGDAVTVAELFLGTPYLWGGNSRAGIDCSGLVQAALLAAGHDCPGDSDMQETLGTGLAKDAPLERGDLLFWKGHVALVADQTRMIHANAFHMAVAYEEIDAGIARIQSQGDGPVTARRRL